MKQILFLVVLALVGYLVLWGGTTNVLHRADINPKKLISNLASGVDENFLPEIDPTRTGFKYTNPNSYQQIKDNILMTYDNPLIQYLKYANPEHQKILYQHLLSSLSQMTVQWQVLFVFQQQYFFVVQTNLLTTMLKRTLSTIQKSQNVFAVCFVVALHSID